jgi:hypothetical protein
MNLEDQQREQELEQESREWIEAHNGDPASLLLLAIKRRKKRLESSRSNQQATDKDGEL